MLGAGDNSLDLNKGYRSIARCAVPWEVTKHSKENQRNSEEGNPKNEGNGGNDTAMERSLGRRR